MTPTLGGEGGGREDQCQGVDLREGDWKEGEASIRVGVGEVAGDRE